MAEKIISVLLIIRQDLERKRGRPAEQREVSHSGETITFFWGGGGGGSH